LLILAQDQFIFMMLSMDGVVKLKEAEILFLLIKQAFHLNH